MQCKVPGCTGVANKHFYTVPVCQVHREKLVDEADLFYNHKVKHKKLYESIRHLTPWKDTEVGDIHCARVEKVKGDKPIAYMIRGEQFEKKRGAKVK